jgi:putative oxidoreductase
MFPPGLPGFALLLLRVSVAIALLLDDYAHRDALPGWVHAIVILISLVISVGYLTPIVAAAAVVVHVSIGFAFGLGADGLAVAIVLCLDATALALLGPGAYSVDSRRFGRRLVVLLPP